MPSRVAQPGMTELVRKSSGDGSPAPGMLEFPSRGGFLGDFRMTRFSFVAFACVLGCASVLQASAAAAATEKVVYSFCGCKDGKYPSNAQLINIKGTLYGSVDGVGGKVFSLDPATGTEKVLHSFQKYGVGGNDPGGLVEVHGVLYGTTRLGGSGSCGCGTIFSLDPRSREEKVLYSFRGYTDGSQPTLDLINVNGTLYGTTFTGGTACKGSGCGTVFSFDPATGVETVMYGFVGGTDGAGPMAGLTNVNGTLYGTTFAGGGGSCDLGCGTVFSVDISTRSESVLYAFQNNGQDGTSPYSALANVNGTLYGTTIDGGAGAGCSGGCGTVFSV